MHLPFGKNIKLYIEGGSHSEKIEMELKGFPAGVRIDYDALKARLKRRSAKGSYLATKRHEEDIPVFTCGIKDGVTTGDTIKAYIENTDIKPSDYKDVNRVPRPSHADFAAIEKYGSDTDLRGGGHFSGRLTALLCVAGAIAENFLKEKGIDIFAHIYSIGNICDKAYDKCSPEKTDGAFPVIDNEAGEKMRQLILSAAKDMDSLGGIIECAAVNLPAGLGEHMFSGVEERICSAVFAIPAVKGISFGSGFAGAELRGSENNDPFYYDGTKVKTKTNNAGGILGGISSGMPVIFSVCIKPTPSIGIEQDSVDLYEHKNVKLKIKGRHDPCIVPRAVPVVESAAALAILDLMLDERPEDDIKSLRSAIENTDSEITELIKKRFSYAEKISEYKEKHALSIENKDRESYLLSRLKEQSGEELYPYAEKIYKTVFEESKKYQRDKRERKIKCGLIGKTLGHSFSPVIHSYLSEYEYKLYELKENELDSFMKNCPADCFNVTVPYKKAVMPYLGFISETAKKTGAVNTVIKKDGRLMGFNTDYSGFSYLLERSGISPKGKKVIIAGSGGASATVRTVMEDRGAEEIIIISRSGENNYNNIEKHLDADIIVNATPLGMYPDNDSCPFDLSRFIKLSGVIDLVYNPSVTRLLYQAEKLNIPHINGLPMLIKQAEDASTIFTGRKACYMTEEIIKITESRTKNIVLTGMPSCGKTTLGKLLAEKTGRPFFDTDEIIKRNTGTAAEDIILLQGEAYFRELETKVIKETGKMSGAVIAAGGGIITKEENYFYMHENSVIIYIERDIKNLCTEGRPLSEAEGNEKLFEERKELYEKYADIKICGDRAADEILKEIEEAI